MTILDLTVICLQEILLKENNLNFKNYQQYNYISNIILRTSGGVSMLIKDDVPQGKINIKTEL